MSTFFDSTNKSDIGKIIHVGAGNCMELNDYASQRFSEILLLEPIPKVFKHLQTKIQKLNESNTQFKVSALNLALSNSSITEAEESTFYITLPNRYSSLLKADKLKNLFQNFKKEQEITVKTIGFSDLVKKANLEQDKNNALVLQINGAEFDVLTQAKADELMLFSSVVIQQSNNNYFENSHTSNDLITLMKNKGFQLAIETDIDVVFTSLVFRKDESALKLKALTKQNNKQIARIAELKAEFENQLKESNEAKEKEVSEVRAEATAKTKDSVEQNKNHTAHISELKAELESQLKASNEASEQNKAQAARITELEGKLKVINEAKTHEVEIAAEQNKKKSARISELEGKLKAKKEQVETTDKLNRLLEQVQNQNSVMIKHHDSIVSKLKYGFDNSVKQVESFIGVQSYLETGSLAMEYHGWPISSDIALFLLGKIERNNYDLIIEFGSGTSTQLFARAINNHTQAKTSQFDDEDLTFIGRDKADSSKLSTVPIELPNRIVTFEHNKKYHNKTKSELEANKLSHLVDLVHAPLIEMKIENEDYLYYSCENKLAQLAAIYEDRAAKILVLIDGPPGATGPLARLPAVPLLLNYLGKHQLDIVLDDSKRKEEKETVVRWKKQFEKRYLDYDEEVVQCEKGVFFCRINP
jgi:FkbM family methyltransferase